METRRYREDQIAKLRDLLRDTTKAIQLGDTYYREANDAYQKSKSICEKLEAANLNLGQILKEQDKQIQSAAQLVLQVRYSAKAISASFSKLQSTEEELTKGLSLVFQKLSQRNIDPNISDKKSLYEFVDSESVDALKVQAQQEMRNIKALVNIGENILTTVEGQFNELSNLNDDSSLKFEYKASFGNEKLSIQMNEINSMHSVLNSISSLHDKVNVIYNSRETTYVDITAYEHKNTSEIPAQVAKMNDSLQRIIENYKRIDAQMQQVNLAFKTVHKIVTLVDKLALDAKAKLTELSSLDATFEQHKHRLTLLFEELSSLVNWYEQFYTAYNELLHEIVRRRQESKRQQEIAEVYQRELDALWKNEREQREDFYEYYGKYLPQSLCPAIFEEPARYQILQENQTLPLPNVQIERSSQLIVEEELASLNINKDT